MKLTTPGSSRCQGTGASLTFLLCLAAAGVSLSTEPAALTARLGWQQGSGVTWQTPWTEVTLDRSPETSGLRLRFLRAGQEVLLERPTVTQPSQNALRLEYELLMPGDAKLAVRRHLQWRAAEDGLALVETFELKPFAPIDQDLEIVRPFTIRRALRGSAAPHDSAAWVMPLKNGWAGPATLSTQSLASEYRLGHWLGDNSTPELALPVVQLDQPASWQAALCADPRFSALFKASAGSEDISGEVRYRYAGSQVPLVGIETRRFGFWLRAGARAEERFGQSIDAFFDLMLPDVPPGPRWLQEIYMVSYDFLSDNGHGWERDVALLGAWLQPEERSHVALCLHGWYDALGAYSFDPATSRLKNQWVAMERTRKVQFTPEELRRRLRLAGALGFRTLLYFADGMAADSGVPGYDDAWAYRDAKGNKISGWQGPDTFGTTYLMNPAHPEVQRRFLRYVDALLDAVGREVDGFVWDETFHARAGQIAFQPAPAYCDRAMLDLVKELTARVERFDPEKVFLASDCVGIAPGIPGYAMVADGLYQDTHCNPERWPDALFPNWRNAYWSCNWGAMSHLHWTRFGVEEFGAPVAISNGWGDDRGPHEWTPAERESFLQLFRQRLARGPVHVRYLNQDPAKLLEERGPDTAPAPSDSIPAPGPNEVNWALAAQGSRARASSEHPGQNRRYPASGAIDGSRVDAGWGTGHGWASAGDAPLPQWLEVEFPEPRPISRFVVVTYQAPKESARRWGVTDYDIEVWEDAAQEWKAVIRENQGRIRFTRVHALASPVTARKFRVVVRKVVPPAGGVARLLQVEAWGT